MDRDGIKKMLEGVKQGDVAVAEAMKSLTNLPFIDTPNARVDTQRSLRMGIPEVVYGPGKTVGHIIEVVTALQSADQTVLVTRLEADVASQVLETLPSGDYDTEARILWFGPAEVPIIGKGTIAIVSAGTSDYFVAAEAAAVARRFGNKVETLVDVGVAGIHRLLASQDVLQNARVLIVVAGMEGALPSVVGGLVDKPVIAVPTSVGYGAALGGIAALLGMLTSCASNVTVVNIDNGFGAAYNATLINRL